MLSLDAWNVFQFEADQHNGRAKDTRSGPFNTNGVRTCCFTFNDNHVWGDMLNAFLINIHSWLPAFWKLFHCIERHMKFNSSRHPIRDAKKSSELAFKTYMLMYRNRDTNIDVHIQHNEWKTMRESSPLFSSYINRVEYAIDNSLRVLLQKVSSFQDKRQWFSKSIAKMVNFYCDVKIFVGNTEEKKNETNSKLRFGLLLCDFCAGIKWPFANMEYWSPSIRQQPFDRRIYRIVWGMIEIYRYIGSLEIETSRMALWMPYTSRFAIFYRIHGTRTLPVDWLPHWPRLINKF